MKAVIVLAMVLGLAACADGPTTETGDANYDAIKAAKAKCEAAGGTFGLKDGGNSRYIQDFACKGT